MPQRHNRPRRLVVAGSTGSVGRQALDIVRGDPAQFEVVGLSSYGNDVDLVRRQAEEFQVQHIAVCSNTAYHELVDSPPRCARPVEIHVGQTTAADICQLDCDAVVNGVAGAAGLLPTLEALRNGRRLILANKESLIIGADLLREHPGRHLIVPVDTEHAGLAQCLRGVDGDNIRRLRLTASGGPFWETSDVEVAAATPAMALDHPTYDMGPEITINSATLMNKGLEILEASVLFQVPLDVIEVVVHPQSVVHAVVECRDGSNLAQFSAPDMRLALAQGLYAPGTSPRPVVNFDWSQPFTWEFFPLDEERFPLVSLARRVGLAGGSVPAVFNAANEESVRRFLDGSIPFPAIATIVHEVTSVVLARPVSGALTLEEVEEADAHGRRAAADVAERLYA